MSQLVFIYTIQFQLHLVQPKMFHFLLPSLNCIFFSLSCYNSLDHDKTAGVCNEQTNKMCKYGNQGKKYDQDKCHGS